MWMKRIPEQIATYLVPALEKYSSPERSLCPFNQEDFIAAQIPDFGTLAPLMQEVGKPVFGITQEDTALVTESGIAWAGGTWIDAEKRMGTYKACLEQVASRLFSAG
jgi:hypothetical protein